MNTQTAAMRSEQPDPGITAEQIAIVQAGWQQMKPIAPQAARLFYERLFELDPSLRALFTSNMEEQGRRLMATLGVVIGSLSELDVLMPAVRNLGRRHAGYGARAEHFDAVGEALLWTLEQGPSFTPSARAAWATVYEMLASTMRTAALDRDL